MRILFLPSYLGGGFGHIGRCLALAEEAEARGWETAFLLGGPHLDKVEGSDRRRVFRLLWSDRPRGFEPAYTLISGMNYQILRDGLTSQRAIRAALDAQFAQVEQFRPDVLVADAWPLAGLLAQRSGVPLVQIVRSGIHPDGPGLLWWRATPPELLSPDPRPLFNPILRSWEMEPVERAEDLLAGDLYLVPSSPELDPLPDFAPGGVKRPSCLTADGALDRTVYVGPLVRQQSDAELEWLAALDPQRPLVYITTGGGAEGVGGAEFYRRLIEAFRDMPQVQGVASTGRRFSPGDFPQPPANLRLESWVNGPAMIARSRLVVYSGGYGTTMEMVQAGVPGVVIPSHSEQESNARRLEVLGVARVLLPSREKPAAVWRKWAGGRYSVLISPHNDLTAADLRSEIEAALRDESMLQAARRLQDVAAGRQGAVKAVDEIEKLTHVGVGRKQGIRPATKPSKTGGFLSKLREVLRSESI